MKQGNPQHQESRKKTNYNKLCLFIKTPYSNAVRGFILYNF